MLVDSYPIIKTALGQWHRETQRALDRIIELYEAMNDSANVTAYSAMAIAQLPTESDAS